MAAGKGTGRAEPASPYTMQMQAKVKPVEAPEARDKVAAPASAPTASRLTTPVILIINGIILVTLVLILYFAFRRPSTSAASLQGAGTSADSVAKASRAPGDSAPKDSVSR